MPLVLPVLGSVYSEKISACGCAPEEEGRALEDEAAPPDVGPEDSPEDDGAANDDGATSEDGGPEETTVTPLLPATDDDGNPGNEEPCVEVTPEPAAELEWPKEDAPLPDDGGRRLVAEVLAATEAEEERSGPLLPTPRELLSPPPELVLPSVPPSEQPANQQIPTPTTHAIRFMNSP